MAEEQSTLISGFLFELHLLSPLASIDFLTKIDAMNRIFKAILAFITAAVIAIPTLAQDQGKDVDVNIDVKSDGQWYQQPWVWIVGAAVFILLLIALLRGSGSKASE
jgi:hypothetical protein